MAQTSGMTNSTDGRITERLDENLKARLEQQGDHLQVKDNSGEHVGTVDGLEGDRIKLTKTDSTDGQHHYVALSQVESMDDVAVYLNVSREEALQ